MSLYSIVVHYDGLEQSVESHVPVTREGKSLEWSLAGVSRDSPDILVVVGEEATEDVDC